MDVKSKSFVPISRVPVTLRLGTISTPRPLVPTELTLLITTVDPPVTFRAPIAAAVEVGLTGNDIVEVVPIVEAIGLLMLNGELNVENVKLLID